jgi:hypothetical protein
VQGVDWMQVRTLIDCTAELKELVAPGGEEDLFRNHGETTFEIMEEEDELEEDSISLGSDLNLHSNAASPTACATGPPST